MGRFLNPDNSAFQAALNANIYVDKTELQSLGQQSLELLDATLEMDSEIVFKKN